MVQKVITFNHTFIHLGRRIRIPSIQSIQPSATATTRDGITPTSNIQSGVALHAWQVHTLLISGSRLSSLIQASQAYGTLDPNRRCSFSIYYLILKVFLISLLTYAVTGALPSYLTKNSAIRARVHYYTLD
jgi:hypothetical protein